MSTANRLLKALISGKVNRQGGVVYAVSRPSNEWFSIRQKREAKRLGK